MRRYDILENWLGEDCCREDGLSRSPLINFAQ